MNNFTSNNMEMFLSAIDADAKNLELATPEMLNNDAIIYRAAQSRMNGNLALKYASDRLKYDANFVKQVLVANGRNLKWLPEELRKDPAIVDLAVANDVEAIVYADKSLLRNTKFMAKQIKTHSRGGIDMLDMLTEEMWADKEIVALAMNNTRSINKYAAKIANMHENNAEIMSKIVKADFENVKLASDELKKTKLKEANDKYKAFTELTRGDITLRELDKKYFQDEAFFDKVNEEYESRIEEIAMQKMEIEDDNKLVETAQRVAFDVKEKLKLARLAGYIAKAKTNQFIAGRKQALLEKKEEIMESIKGFMAGLKDHSATDEVKDDLSK